jgi:alkanesulfonate monooxygenase SsuD/methylene tetrahydromethanopterin reductase-like flavin-dependent oxidoreductase (luciferase family)
MPFQISIFDHIEKRRDVSLDRQYAERLALVEEAERQGFYCYHIAEHHNSPLCMGPSPSLFLASAAQRTSTLRFGAMVYLLPFYHPLRLIEEVCMLDNLSGGRLEIGVGRGISGLEHDFWGHGADEARERFDETLDVLLKGLTSLRLNHRGRMRFDDVPMELNPSQKPHPPIWYAGNADYAGAHGFHLASFGNIGSLPGTVAAYRRALQASGNAEGEHKAGSVRWVYVAPSDAEALDRARRAWAVYADNFPKRGYEDDEYLAGIANGPRGRATSPAVPFDQAVAAETIVAGSPTTVRDYVQAYASKSDANYLMTALQWGDLTHDEAVASMRLFGSEVMPGVVDNG